MEIFIRLLLGHLLADFTLQTNYIAHWKRYKLSVLLLHVLIHPLCYIPLVWPYLNDVWVSPFGIPITGRIALLIATVLHFIEDWFRVTMVNRGWKDTTLFYVWDQVVHLAVLIYISPIGTQSIQTIWPIVASFGVVVTHFSTVTVWFIEKDIDGADYPETDEKYIVMLQRFVVWLAFFLPDPWWFIVLIAVIVAFGRHVLLKKVDFSIRAIAFGNVIAIGAGILTRFGLGIRL